MSNSLPSPTGMRRQPRQARSQERVNRILDVAEALFIAEGYNATTTSAIAKRAKVAIGSLYQFFPDKAAILQGLALRYSDLLYQRLSEPAPETLAALPLADYVDLIIDTTDQFFTDYPGYYAIFMPLQGTMPELQKIEAAADAQLIQDMATELSLRGVGLDAADYEAMAFVLVKAIGTLLWLALGQEKPFRQRLMAETKRLTLQYLQSYFSSDLIPANVPAGAD
ncbi:TetR family transcriptional regulator [filamentous cyanobacterium CCP3]|nr:TetR family transcriptional regulator [filamentous cyanobacterium CCP3]